MGTFLKKTCIIGTVISLISATGYASSFTSEDSGAQHAAAGLHIEDNRVALPLESVLLLALKNNLDITFAGLQPEAVATDIQREEGRFDMLFSSQFSKYRDKKQVANVLAGSGESAELYQERYSLEAALQKRFTLGTQAELKMSHNESRTGLPFAGLVPEYYSELTLGLTQPLLRDFGIEIGRSMIQIANLNHEVSEMQFRQQVMDVLYQVEAFYWNLYFRIADLESKRKSLARASDLQRNFRIRIEAGTLAPIEIHQADAEVALRTQEVIVAEARVSQAEDNLKYALNLYDEEQYWDLNILPSDAPEKSLVEPDVRKCIAIALERRPDFKQAKLGIDISDVQLRYTQNQLRPRVDLFGSIGTNGMAGRSQDTRGVFGPFPIRSRQSPWHGKRKDTLEYMRDRDYYSYTFGIRFEMPIGNRTAKSQHTRARVEAAQAAIMLKSVENAIINDVRESIRLIETSRKVIDSATATLTLTREKLKAEEKKYEVGMSTTFAVLEYQSDLAHAESNLAFAYAEHRKSIVNLNRVMGILLEEKGLVL